MSSSITHVSIRIHAVQEKIISAITKDSHNKHIKLITYFRNKCFKTINNIFIFSPQRGIFITSVKKKKKFNLSTA